MISPQQLVRGIQRFIRNRAGTSAIELAFCMPLIAGMIVPLTDLGMGAYTQMQVINAAQAGAEYAAQMGLAGYSPTNIGYAVANATGLSGVTVPAASPVTESCGCVDATSNAITNITGTPPCSSSSCPSGSVGTFVTVTAQATYTTLFDYTPVLPNAVTLTAQSVVRIK